VSLRTWRDLVPGFYRVAGAGVGIRVDVARGDIGGWPVCDIAALAATPVGWRVTEVRTWEVIRPWLLARLEPMEPPR
jgi:hypothetical protein